MQTQSASWFDLCIASQFAPGGLRVQFCQQLCKWEVIPTTAYRPWHPAVLSEHGAAPPILAKLRGNGGHFQTSLDLRGNAWFLCYRNQMDNRFLCYRIQMDNRERIKGLAENPDAASELGSSRSIHFNFFPLKERREEKTSLFHTQSSINLLEDNLKRNFLPVKRGEPLPTHTSALTVFDSINSEFVLSLYVCTLANRSIPTILAHFSFLWSNSGIWKMENVK